MEQPKRRNLSYAMISNRYQSLRSAIATTKTTNLQAKNPRLAFAQK